VRELLCDVANGEFISEEKKIIFCVMKIKGE
jgi:hypothetical protein